ncbi:SPOR domain-containing protein [Thalassovita taeanensis]|uniref:Sporulation related domain-containing protein n=1 Tax=Thalassovita taeanensis TaxID=657014 RepID=A0A1H9GAC9_9RHOB|nr:SPOR domain-containing protein [Thalassovita taeanensis]SEQ46728.1 Sporulation related domain-containing protein [Thalassovita taeanensis]
MKITSLIAYTVIVASLGLGTVQAQSLRNADEPAEFPPSSYKGSQYVDSKGCVYIRAGINGNVTWIPRVSRARQQLCGAQPTFANAKPAAPAAPVIVAAAPAPKPAPAPTPVRKPVVKAVAPVVVAKPAPRVATAKVGQPMRTTATLSTPPKVVTVKPAPRYVTKTAAKPKTVAAPAPRPVAVASACTGGTAVSQRYVGTGSDVRCGPQAEPPVTYGTRSRAGTPARYSALTSARVGQVATPATVSPQTRVAPKHVYTTQVQARQGVHVPKGYRKVWDDDRLNTKRGHQTFAGKAQMDLIWTKDTPRKLIDRSSGRDMTRYNPNLVYPYTDLATQQRTLAATERQALQPQPRIVVSSKSRTPQAVSAPVKSSTKTSAKAAHRYVQVGTFGVAANAQKSAARLQRAGLPVRMAKYSKSGKQYRIVLAGPFTTQAQLGQALGTARKAGFRDAFVRK